MGSAPQRRIQRVRAGVLAAVPFATALCIALLLAAPATGQSTTSTTDQATRLASTLEYLEKYTAQKPNDDGFAPYLVEAALAWGLDPATWPPASPALGRVTVPDNDTALLPRLRPMFALAIAGQLAPDSVAVGDVWRWFDGRQFGSRDAVNDDVWAIRVLLAAGVDATEPRLQAAVRDLLLQRWTEAGWGWSRGAPPETDMTAMAIVALREAGVPVENLTAPYNWILGTTNVDGGTPLADGGPSNCDSTVWRLRAEAAMAAEEDVGSRVFLKGLRNDDGGYGYLAGRASNTLCTAEMATMLGDGLMPDPADPTPTPPPTPEPSKEKGLPGPGLWAIVALTFAGAFAFRRVRQSS